MNGNRTEQRSQESLQPCRRTTGSAHSINIHIQELVLQGFSLGERYQIGDTIKRDLARLLAEPGILGLPTHSAMIDQIDGGTFNVARGSAGQTVGLQVARILYQRLSCLDKTLPSSSECASR